MNFSTNTGSFLYFAWKPEKPSLRMSTFCVDEGSLRLSASAYLLAAFGPLEKLEVVSSLAGKTEGRSNVPDLGKGAVEDDCVLVFELGGELVEVVESSGCAGQAMARRNISALDSVSISSDGPTNERDPWLTRKSSSRTSTT